MVDSASYVNELDIKNKASIERHLGGFLGAIMKESLTVPEMLKVELKYLIEGAEIAALWMTDCEDLALKMTLAAMVGDGARQYRAVWDRLAVLGTDLNAYDPRHGGLSRLFAFMRSLQTTEERTSAAHLTLDAMSIARFGALGAWCEQQGDADTARLYRETLADDSRRHYEVGRGFLLGVALAEESQARARRASYRTLELLGEIFEPGALRRVARTKK